MRRLFFIPFLLGFLLATNRVLAETLRLSADGIEIEAGSLGKFTLDYPLLLDAAHKPAHKLLARTRPARPRR